MRRIFVAAFLGAASLALLAPHAPRTPADEARPATAAAQRKQKDAADPAAVARARKNVLMLDDVYKTAVVLITDKYVHTKKDFAAGRAAVKWFKAVSDKGSHEVRLLDASGEPNNQANVAKDEFDQEGIRQIKAGKSFFEKVEVHDGKPYLRAMTPIPVVMDKCIMCHENYKQAKKGEAIGALTYKMPIE